MPKYINGIPQCPHMSTITPVVSPLYPHKMMVVGFSWLPGDTFAVAGTSREASQQRRKRRKPLVIC